MRAPQLGNDYSWIGSAAQAFADIGTRIIGGSSKQSTPPPPPKTNWLPIVAVGGATVVLATAILSKK